MMLLNTTITFLTREECVNECNQALKSLVDNSFYLKIIIIILFLLVCFGFSINLIQILFKKKGVEGEK